MLAQYGAEVLPIALRSKIMGIAAASHFIVNVGITEAGPSAFANIRENYYYVFVGCTAFFLVIAYFYFPETRHKTLGEQNLGRCQCLRSMLTSSQ
jgi:hypothetical protein